jgi:hypothetical protein
MHDEEEEEEEGVGGTHEEKEGATQRNILFLCFVFMRTECFENADMMRILDFLRY